MSDDDSQQKEDMDLVEKACIGLGEHFDTVMIFATRLEAGELDGTVNINFGSGNWFARYGQVKAWIVKQEERDRKHVREEE